jgi:single-stranded-DNA-specific exonuclease
MGLAELLRNAGPWGQGFPEPVFEGEFLVINRRIVGEKHLKMVLQAVDSQNHIDAIAFNAGELIESMGVNQLRLVYRVDVNDFRGNQTLQLIIEHINQGY